MKHKNIFDLINDGMDKFRSKFFDMVIYTLDVHKWAVKN